MKLKYNQKFYIQSLIIDNKLQNYVQVKEKFSDTFKDINFLLSEDNKKN